MQLLLLMKYNPRLSKEVWTETIQLFQCGCNPTPILNPGNSSLEEATPVDLAKIIYKKNKTLTCIKQPDQPLVTDLDSIMVGGKGGYKVQIIFL